MPRAKTQRRKGRGNLRGIRVQWDIRQNDIAENHRGNSFLKTLRLCGFAREKLPNQRNLSDIGRVACAPLAVAPLAATVDKP